MSPFFCSSLKSVSCLFSAVDLDHNSIMFRNAEKQNPHFSSDSVAMKSLGCACSRRYGAQLGQQQQRCCPSFFPGIQPPALPSVASHPGERPAASQCPSQHRRQESASHRSLQSISLSVNCTFIYSFFSRKAFSRSLPSLRWVAFCLPSVVFGLPGPCPQGQPAIKVTPVTSRGPVCPQRPTRLPWTPVLPKSRVAKEAKPGEACPSTCRSST